MTRLFFEIPSRVSWVVFKTLGGGGGELSQAKRPATATTTDTITAGQSQRGLRAGAGAATASIFPEVVSRLRRFRSALTSAAD